MEKRTKLRLFGAIVLLFNIWLIGRYDINGGPTLLMTFGFALCYEFMVVRVASPSDPHEEVRKKSKFGQVLLWAGFGAVLSLFLSHPPPDHLNPVDRIADRTISLIIWALLGAAAAILFSFFRRTPPKLAMQSASNSAEISEPKPPRRSPPPGAS